MGALKAIGFYRNRTASAEEALTETLEMPHLSVHAQAQHSRGVHAVSTATLQRAEAAGDCDHCADYETLWQHMCKIVHRPCLEIFMNFKTKHNSIITIVQMRINLQPRVSRNNDSVFMWMQNLKLVTSSERFRDSEGTIRAWSWLQQIWPRGTTSEAQFPRRLTDIQFGSVCNFSKSVRRRESKRCGSQDLLRSSHGCLFVCTTERNPTTAWKQRTPYLDDHHISPLSATAGFPHLPLSEKHFRPPTWSDTMCKLFFPPQALLDLAFS